VKERVLDPLGMGSSQTTITTDLRRRLATGYEHTYDDRPVPLGAPVSLSPQVAGETVAYGFLCGRDYDTHQFVSAKRPTGLSRHGVVAWVGVGSVAPSFGDLKDWLPNWGVGYRFEVQPRMNVRMDLGFGKEYLESGNKFVSSVYFNFTEAF